MASIYWLGTASTGTQQEDRFTPGGTIEVGDVFTITLTDPSGSGTSQAVTATATGTTVAQVCADLLTAWNASTASLKSGITATDQTTYFKLLGTAGVPFYATPGTTESGGGAADDQTFTRTATTAASNPGDWNTAANWSGGAVPVNGDAVTIDGRGAAAVVYGLNQSAVTLASLTIKLANGNNVGTTTSKLRVGATVCNVGEKATDGSRQAGTALVNLDFGTAQTTCTVYGSKNTGTSGLEPVMLAGSHADNALVVHDGIVGVATNLPGDTATFATVTVDGGTVNLGAGVTHATVKVLGTGKVAQRAASTTTEVDGGTLATDGTFLIGTLTANGGRCDLLHRNGGSDCVTTLNLRGGAVDFSGNAAAATVDAISVRSGTLVAPKGGLTPTTVTLDFDGNARLAVAASLT
jgi:hypothetical protein